MRIHKAYWLIIFTWAAVLSLKIPIERIASVANRQRVYSDHESASDFLYWCRSGSEFVSGCESGFFPETWPSKQLKILRVHIMIAVRLSKHFQAFLRKYRIHVINNELDHFNLQRLNIFSCQKGLIRAAGPDTDPAKFAIICRFSFQKGRSRIWLGGRWRTDPDPAKWRIPPNPDSVPVPNSHTGSSFV